MICFFGGVQSNLQSESTRQRVESHLNRSTRWRLPWTMCKNNRTGRKGLPAALVECNLASSLAGPVVFLASMLVPFGRLLELIFVFTCAVHRCCCWDVVEVIMSFLVWLKLKTMGWFFQPRLTVAVGIECLVGFDDNLSCRLLTTLAFKLYCKDVTEFDDSLSMWSAKF